MISNPVPWPNGARVAVCITFDIDSDSILHLAHQFRAEQLIATQSWLRYDRIAVPRIVEMFRRFGIKQTFFFPAWCMEQYPELVDCVLGGEHEIGFHGYIHEHPNEQSREDERYWLQRSIDVIERMTGRRPVGARAPLYNFSKHSADLLVQEGFLYDASLMGDDVPYVLEAASGVLLELPSHWAMDDWPQYTHSIDMDYLMQVRSPDEAMKVYMAEFDAMWEHSGLLIAVWHPWVSGRLARCMRVERMIEEMLQRGNVWFAPLQEIAQHVNGCIAEGSFVPRFERLPTYDGPVSRLAGTYTARGG